MAELLSGPFFSFRVSVLVVLHLFTFLSFRIESSDCMQVSRFEFVDDFR